MNQTQQDLINRVYRNFQTTMIGSLARFEEKFGFLWEKEHKDQAKYEDLWEDTRNRNGGCFSYKVSNPNKIKHKYHYKFFFDNDNNNHRNTGE